MPQFKSFEEYQKYLDKMIEEIKRDAFDDTFKIELAKFARDRLVARVRSGFGVTDDKAAAGTVEKEALTGLSTIYKKRRAKIPLSVYARPGKSNLTLTGQMLDAVTFDILAQGFELLIKDSKRREGGDASNYDIAAYNSKNGRPFFNLTTDEYKVIMSKVSTRFRKVVREKTAKFGGQ